MAKPAACTAYEVQSKFRAARFAAAARNTILLLTHCVCAEERPARDSQEAEQPIFVYRLLKKKEVNKDLVNQEVLTLQSLQQLHNGPV